MKDEFLYDLIDLPISFLASKWILERIPHVFDGDTELYIQWKEELSQKIHIDSSAIVFTGSSCCGFSLNPRKNYRDFAIGSDIDVALISQHYFDISWHTLRNLGTRYYDLVPRQRSAVDDHVNRLIYWGTIATDKILGILPFGKEWLIALNEMGQKKPFENRTVNIRIYKDFESLRDYQAKNLDKLRHKLLENS